MRYYLLPRAYTAYYDRFNVGYNSDRHNGEDSPFDIVGAIRRHGGKSQRWAKHNYYDIKVLTFVLDDDVARSAIGQIVCEPTRDGYKIGDFISVHRKYWNVSEKDQLTYKASIDKVGDI